MNSSKKKSPLVRVNMAQSMDGHVIQPNGQWRLGSAEDKRTMDKLRLWADCLIASRRSLANDNPFLCARSKPNAKNHPRPVIILKNPGEKISPDLRIFSPPHPKGEFWIHTQSGLQGVEGAGEGGEPLLRYGLIEEGSFEEKAHGGWEVYFYDSMQDVVDSLSGRGFLKILLEGGPALNGYFLQQDLIDEIFFTIVPYLWGGDTKDRLITSSRFIDMAKFRLLNCRRRKDEVFFRYKKI